QQLRDPAGRRPHHPGRHVPARLPAAAGDADRRGAQAAPQDLARAARPEAGAEAGRPEGRTGAVLTEVRQVSGPSEEQALDRAQLHGALPAGQQRPGMFGVTGTGDTSGFAGLQRQPWVELPAQRPYGGYFDEVMDAFEEAYAGHSEAVRTIVVDRDELTIHIAREHIAEVCKVFRDDPALRFELLSSISGVDYLARDGADGERLHVVYHLTSMTFRRRIRLEVAVT